jgi:NAD(P)-dependent dehydrogenase (short-subunit alcohol dehydrogenase family)
MRNKVVVITGASRGFGYAMARAMLKAGASVVISGRSKAALRRAAISLQNLGSISAIQCDVREERQVYDLARRAMKQFGRIDIWINNAGQSVGAGMILDIPPAQAMEAFMTNDMGTLYGARAALHFMLPHSQGTLVNIYGNGSFLRPASPTALYGATKAWVTSFTRSLAKEISGSGVRLVGFSPGMLLTEMLTNPIVIGEQGRAVMKNYAFILRLLGGSPEKAAERLVSVLQTNQSAFIECRLFKPWTPFLGMLRLAWENITHSGTVPKFQLTFKPAHRARI